MNIIKSIRFIFLFILTFSVIIYPEEIKHTKYTGIPFAAKKWSKWIHIQFLGNDLEKQKKVAEKAAALGYDTVVLMFFGRVSLDCGVGDGVFSKQDTQKLINYITRDLKMTVIPEIKLLAKSERTYGKNFVKNNPDFFIKGKYNESSIIDPFFKINGKTLYDLYIIGLIDELIDLFKGPAIFILGYDEYDSTAISQVAEKNNLSTQELWAGTLNKVSKYLIDKNISPMIWGDMLLSKRLADDDNPVGYPADEGFNYYEPLNSRYPSDSPIDTLDFVREIKYREKMIIGDWHYNGGDNKNRYPSIDYFKWLGFGGILGATWGDMKNTKNFSAYAKNNNCMGMICTLFHYISQPELQHLLFPTLENNILLMNNPEIQIPAPSSVIITKDDNKISCVRPGDKIKIAFKDSDKERDLEIFKYGDRRNMIISITNQDTFFAWQIPAGIEGFIDIIGRAKNKTGFKTSYYLETALLISDKTYIRRKSDCLLGFSFPGAVTADNEDFILLDGKSDIGFALKHENAKIVSDGILCSGAGGIKICRSPGDAYAIKNGFTILIEFTVNEFPKPPKSSCLFAWGPWGKGPRVFIQTDGSVIGQVGTGGAIAAITSSDHLKKSERNNIKFICNGKNILLYLNGKKNEDKFTAAVEAPLDYAISLGCIFKNDTKYFELPKGINHEFHGKIHKLEVRDDFVFN